MSAVMTSRTAELYFKATRLMPRRLTLELSKGGYLYIYARAGVYSIAYTCERLEDAKLYRIWKPAVLAVSGTHFHLTEPEASEIERVLGPLGLWIERRGDEKADERAEVHPESEESIAATNADR